MKKKISSKKCIAVILAVVMIITSIPLMMVGAEIIPGSYDPAPYFSEDAIKQGADAWLDDDGNIQVEFPAATPKETFKGEATTIAFYILELVNMGGKTEVHKKEVLDTIKVTGTSATFKAADIGTIDFENNRYSVIITAVDNENWFSQSMYATVSDIPAISLDPEKFEGFSTSNTAVREIMTFESGETDDGVVTGGQLLYMGTAAEAGTEDLTDNIGDTNALRFIMNSQPTSTQIFDTSYSRSTWDYKGATEMWYWMDLTNVELKGVSFRLRTNEKMWLEWIDDDTTLDTYQRVGSIVYSTKGTAASTYTGEDPYVYVQREDGGWNKVMLNADGTADIGNFKGYVRVPLKFMCSETDSYIDISNQDLAAGHNYKSGINNTVQDSDVQNWLRSMTFGKITVDKAGTSIQDALLIHRRGLRSSSGFMNGGDRHLYLFNADGITHLKQSYTNGNPPIDYSKAGFMLAVPLDETQAKTTVTTGNYSADRAYIANGTVQNREAGLKAIEDIYNAGFSVEGCSADSLQHSFYVDNIFFYRENDDKYDKYTENTLNNKPNTGDPMSVYYDEALEISRIIFDEIDKYIEDPDWADYREIKYIFDLIETYRQIYESKGRDTAFLSLDKTDDGDGIGLAAAAEKLGRDSWAKAWDAYEKCKEAGTYGSANADRNELVPLIIRAMEKLPAPESITAVSDALRAEIIKIWKAYSRLNVGQLDMLGKAEEEKILKYVALLDGTEKTEDDFIVGQQLADNPFIVFNDFEKYEIGEKAWQLEDNQDAYTTGFQSANGVVAGTSNLANDWRHTKSLVTYTTNGTANITDSDYYGYVTTDDDKSQEAIDGKVNYNASWATVTDEGHLNSHGVNLHVDSSFTASENDGSYHTVTLTKDGNPIGADYGNNMSGVNLGGIAQGEYKGGTENTPLSIVFYVDFSKIKNFHFTVNLFTTDGNGRLIKARTNLGLGITDAAKQENWKYFILDPETGSWVLNHSTSQYVFNSNRNTNWGDTLGLDGYKGYIMIPLYHIKVKESVSSETKMDENATYLNNIFAVQFCIAGANGESLDDKSVIFDNVGFTYSDWYSAYSTRSDKSYAEVFGAKSLPAKNFENAVAAVDIYDDATRATKVNEALTLYNALPEYQKAKVADAKAILDKYQRIVSGTETLETALYTVDQLNAFVESLPDAIKNTTVSGDYDIPYPGYSAGQVNYASMGIDKATAEQIVDYYNNGYKRFSATQKAAITNATGFLNAYNMAMRMTSTLENIKSDAFAFLPQLVDLYNVKYDYEDDGILDDKNDSVTNSDDYKIGNFLKIEERATAKQFFEEKYSPLEYYSKASIDDGSIYPQLKNTSRGFTYFLKNTETYNIDGEEIKGGILTFQEKLQTVYNIASEHIANRVRFSADELQYVKDILDEYNSFLPAYYNVEELYELEQKIVRLFSVGDITIMDAETEGSSLTTVALNNNDEESMKDTAYVDLSYIAALLDTTVTLQAVSDLKLTQTSGTTFADLNSFTVDGLTADTPLTIGTYDNLYPDEVFSRIPLQIAVDPTIASAVPKDAVYEGLITFNVYETADIDAGLTGEDLVPIATLELPVTFTGTLATAYTVTIPAKVQVDWDTTDNVDVSYSVEASLANKKLSVSVKDSGAEAGKLVDSTGTHTLAFTATNFKETTFTGDVAAGTTPPDKPSIKIEQTAWDNAPVGDYSTQLTYTVGLTS